jgi:hypothetical protein
MKTRFFLGETKQYNSFKFSESNREISTKKVNKFIKLIKKQGLQVPIIVNEDKFIVDGQHRFVALRRLKMTIPYIVSRAWKNEEDTIIMQEGTKWTALDYCRSKAVLGNVDCEQALDVAESWNKLTNNKMSKITCLELLKDGSYSGVLKSLKDNLYKLNLSVASDIFKCLNLVKEYPIGTNLYGQKLCRALKTLYLKNNGLDEKKIVKLFSKNYVKGFASEKDQYEYIKDLYNKY